MFNAKKVIGSLNYDLFVRTRSSVGTYYFLLNLQIKEHYAHILRILPLIRAFFHSFQLVILKLYHNHQQ